MSRFTTLFNRTVALKRPAFIPFIMLGYPSLELNLTVIDAMIQGGADAIEFGFPFSDPIADGPIIQQAASHALSQGVTPTDCFQLIKKIRQCYPLLPIGLLVYANLVYHQGLTDFYSKAKDAGVDAVLIPDVPTIEADIFAQTAKTHGIQPVLLATPACTQQDLEHLAALCEGFTYVVTRKGVTGFEKASEFNEAMKIVDKLTLAKAPFPVFGFGLKNAQDVNNAYLHGAKGAIIGSALVAAIAKMSPAIIQDGHTITQLTRELFIGIVI